MFSNVIDVALEVWLETFAKHCPMLCSIVHKNTGSFSDRLMFA